MLTIDAVCFWGGSTKVCFLRDPGLGHGLLQISLYTECRGKRTHTIQCMHFVFLPGSTLTSFSLEILKCDNVSPSSCAWIYVPALSGQEHRTHQSNICCSHVWGDWQRGFPSLCPPSVASVSLGWWGGLWASVCVAWVCGLSPSGNCLCISRDNFCTLGSGKAWKSH